MEDDIAKKYFPLAGDEQAAQQLNSLMKAKEWMKKRKIVAMTPNSTFTYARSTGAVLGEQRK